MEILIKNKKIILIMLCILFVVGIIGFIYVKIKGENSNYNFYDNVINADVSIENESNQGVNNIVGNCSENEEYIYIHIIGEVKNQGIVKLKKGQRIVDAIEKSGGITELADLSKVNLAFILSDGQKVNIPNINDDFENFEYVIDNSGKNIIVDNGSNISKGGNKVNINTASQTELETLTGIGPSTASKIIEYREKNGKFITIEDLKNVSGIGETRYEAIKENIVVK